MSGSANSPAKRRTYDSSGRRRLAEERRARALDAAWALFSERGFEGTTIGDIAEAAEVSPQYLQKLGSKTELFVLAIETLTVGPQQRTTQRVAADFETIAATITRDEYLDMLASNSAEWNSRSYGMWRAWASTSDPELRAKWESLMAEIREGWNGQLTRFGERGWWRTDIPREEQAAALWLLTMAETYERMTQVAGLTHEQYIAWLRRAATAVLVAPGDESR